MDTETAIKLNRINAVFYSANAASFSASRERPWPGWRRCLELLADDAVLRQGELRVLDLACGNLRFEEFLLAELPATGFEFHAVDNNAALPAYSRLAASASVLTFQELDIVATLLEGKDLSAAISAGPFDLSVCFGFLHHVPTADYRQAVLQALVDKTRPGGYVIASFWQFMTDTGLAAQAEAGHWQALQELGLPELDQGDYLLGWQNTANAWRYCHNFTDDEIVALANNLADKAEPVASFYADGRTGSLNSYLLLRVTG